MPSEDSKILEFYQYHKLAKALLVINVDLKFLIKKIDRCKNNPKKSTTRKVGEHIPSSLSMYTTCHSKLWKRSLMKVKT